ncbi:diguanylate cyclase [Terasakiella sp. A23]|uniref:diguanylate cyclase domain-containing protein n=1 Tax=Terasakiella sp. FCG-A23 TaxID=3080561 RepID=UPI0029558C44|nr:diguanylate cyclase [Terasakiella sp. A23]MDV7341670.1 diguanylate cyclase [Terasakiella sp. A23]
MTSNTDQSPPSIEEANLLQAVINAVPVPIFFKDSEGRYLGCNRAFEEYVGKSKEELVGFGVFDLFDRELAEVYHKADLALMDSQGKQVYEAQVEYADGTIRDVMFHKACFHAVSEDINGIVGAILDITDRKRAEMELEHRAMTDALTGLNNRYSLIHELNHALKLSKRTDNRVVFMMLDLDDFKKVNDTYGHPAGDELMVEAARRLRDCVRESDTVARIGGDEFAVVLERMAGKEDASIVAQKIIDALSEPFEVEGNWITVGGSIGIACSPKDGVTSLDLMKMADIALYNVKDRGKGQFSYYSDPE